MEYLELNNKMKCPVVGIGTKYCSDNSSLAHPNGVRGNTGKQKCGSYKR